MSAQTDPYHATPMGEQNTSVCQPSVYLNTQNRTAECCCSSTMELHLNVACFALQSVECMHTYARKYSVCVCACATLERHINLCQLQQTQGEYSCLALMTQLHNLTALGQANSLM